jgi:hypothetical protein
MLRFTYWIHIILFLFIPVLSTGASGNNKTVEASPVIQIKDNLLTVKVKDMPLKRVLIEIAKQIPTKIVTAVPVEDRIGTEFSRFPIVKGLERLLRGYNYVFIHNPEKSTGDEHEIRKIIITSREGGSRHRRMEPVIAYTEKPPIEYPGKEQYDKDIMISEANAQGGIGSEIALDPLRDALQDADTGVRLSAVGALGVIGGDMAIQALEKALTDNDEAVRMFATAELKRLKGKG